MEIQIISLAIVSNKIKLLLKYCLLIKLEIESSESNGLFCADVYVFHNSRINNFVTIMTSGTHKIKIKITWMKFF